MTSLNMFFVVTIGLAGSLASATEENNRPEAGSVRRVLRVVYFVPSDRKSEPDFRDRIDRVLSHVQQFYRAGMAQNGYGKLSFELDRNDRKELNIFEVRGKRPMRDYGRNDADKVRREVKEALARDRIDIDSETVVIFQLLLDWQGNKAVEIGPFVGGGGPKSGTAWVYDDAKLDPRLLSSQKPGGYYAGPCSLGAFNTHYIGGVAHELGHAFGLPHDQEQNVDAARYGRSLMGAGNHTYGQELRGEGKGAFLSPASAMSLSTHPLFTGKPLSAETMTCRLADLESIHSGGKLVLKGKLEGVPRVIGLVGYNDPVRIPGDYDAVGWTCPVTRDGTFQLTVGQLEPGEHELRLRACAEGGATRTFGFRYRIDSKRVPDLEPFASALLLKDADEAFRAADRQRLARIASELDKRLPARSESCRRVEHLRQLLSPSKPRSLGDIEQTAKAVAVADLQLDSASVGWGQAWRNRVHSEGAASCLIEVGGTFFESGFYAHAPARHALRLDGKWSRFTTKYGLQDGHDGSVVFLIKGDGVDLFRSPVIRDHKVREMSVDVSGIKRLEMIVEDAGDGRSFDWGVWLNPQLQR